MINQAMERVDLEETRQVRAQGAHATGIPQKGGVWLVVRVGDGRTIRSFSSEEGVRGWVESRGCRYTPLEELPLDRQHFLHHS
jgi:hypothetical protein